jgi:2-polyprenyl-3-methyl-5-hydroxy-6-metoxy-1,4-benzoquinol methylase
MILENEPIEQERDFFKRNLKELPYFRALLRAVESRFYQNMLFTFPILDLGCGDGLFGKATFSRKLSIGLDPAFKSLHQAHHTHEYRWLINSTGIKMPFSDHYFSSVISNSVLEHIPEVKTVLTEIKRVLQPGGIFVFCVPNQYFTKNLSIGTFLDRIHLNKFARFYRDFFNKISRHYHCDSQGVWQNRLREADFHIIRCWNYFSPSALHVLEWGHYFGFPYWISKRIFGKWVLIPSFNQTIIYSLLKKYYLEKPEHKYGSYTFYVCRRK